MADETFGLEAQVQLGRLLEEHASGHKAAAPGKIKVVHDPERLGPQQFFRLLEIAHETKCAAIRKAAMSLFQFGQHPIVQGVRADPEMTSDPVLDASTPIKIWLWRDGGMDTRQRFIAYEHEYPCVTPGGNPLTLGEPAATAMLMPSSPRKIGDQCVNADGVVGTWQGDPDGWVCVVEKEEP